jgi:site-specific DNA-methyltransferase (adenine-specific)
MSDIELINDDCLEVMKDMPDKSIDMILCDLPYGITKCKWDIPIPFDLLWEQYNRIIKENGCIALLGTEPFASYLRISNIKNYKYDWVWDKTIGRGHLIAKYQPMRQTEYILIFGKKRINYYPIMIDKPKEKIRTSTSKGKSNIYGFNTGIKLSKKSTQYYPKNLLVFNNAAGDLRNNSSNKNRVHPTQKPVPLLEYLIKTYTLENETVLDNCMGSGSTGIACIHLNRNFIGIEKDKNYFDIALNRLSDELKKL